MRTLKRWSYFLVFALTAGITAPARAKDRLPNFVVLFADDLGYGDIGCYGHPTIRTPNLDRMAAGGMRFTQFYAAAPLCTPSRAALLTGRLPARPELASLRRVLFPRDHTGLPDTELTLAEALKSKGYVTACIGKWHLGHLPPYLPTRHGFDEYFGIPYSNDMNPRCLMRNETVIEPSTNLELLTPRYTEEAISFLKKNHAKPFFLYLPYTFPHSPLAASDRFRGKSLGGLYGDAVEELDWSVGEVLKTLDDLKLADNTLVVFTSDNGPWMDRRSGSGGSAGLLRGGKSTTWEGGLREPGIFYWPGRIKAGSVNMELAGTLDLFPTFLALARVDLPGDHEYDGYNIVPALLGTGPSPRHLFFYYRNNVLMAVRKDKWKLHIISEDPEKRRRFVEHEQPLLFNLETDPSEKFDVAQQHPDVVADLRRSLDAHVAQINPTKAATLPAAETR